MNSYGLMSAFRVARLTISCYGGPKRCGFAVTTGIIVSRVDFGGGPAAEAGEHVLFHAPPPVMHVVPAAPAAPVLFKDTSGGFCEGRNALDAAFLGEGSPPDRASMRLARTCSRALASGTSVAAPSPSSRHRSLMTSRWTQLRVPVGLTNRYSPLPSAWRPGGAEPTKVAERALSGWRPRGLV